MREAPYHFCYRQIAPLGHFSGFLSTSTVPPGFSSIIYFPHCRCNKYDINCAKTAKEADSGVVKRAFG
jgi:hypothetical protein